MWLKEAATYHGKVVPWNKGVEICDAIGVAIDEASVIITARQFCRVCATNARRKEAEEEACCRHPSHSGRRQNCFFWHCRGGCLNLRSPPLVPLG